MRRLKLIACTTLSAAVVLGCGEEAGPEASDTTRMLLSQPRADDVSTPLNSALMLGAEPSLDIDQLGMNVGSQYAPVKVIEFVDFGCGYCRKFQLETFDSIRAEFIDTGMLEWKFMPFVSGSFANSLVVTEAAECALDQDPQLFGALESSLWVEQSEWKRSDEPEALLRGWITGMGGDGVAYDSCMEEDLRMDRVTSSTAVAVQLGVRSTPTFWIVGAGPVQGALPLDVFRQLFQDIHAQLTQSAS